MGEFKKDDDQLPVAGLPKKEKPLFGEESEVKVADPLAMIAARKQEQAVAQANVQVMEEAKFEKEKGLMAKLKRLVGINGKESEEARRKLEEELKEIPSGSRCGCW